MKKIFKPFIFACTIALLSVSCDSDENSHSYSGSNITYYDAPLTYSINASDNDDNTASVVVLATTLSSSDRQISLSVDPTSTAVLGVDFNMPATVTIPANSYKGTVVVTSMFTATTLAGAKVFITITDPSAAQFKNQAVVNLKHRSCVEIAPTLYTGGYLIELVDGDNGYPGGSLQGSSVTLVDTGVNSRTINVPFLLPTAMMDIELNFDCSYITIEPTVTPVTCGGDIEISAAPAGSEGTYLPTDDSVFYFTYMETFPENCGAAHSAMMTYKLTKI